MENKYTNIMFFAFVKKQLTEKVFFIFGIVIFLIFATSCRGSRKLKKKTSHNLNTDFLFEQINKNNFDFETLSLKFSGNYDDGEMKIPLGGQMRMEKDNIIWISVAPFFGIEVVRILISPDSVKYYDRLKKTYYKQSFGYINKYLNTDLDFEILQSLLLGNDFGSYQKDGFQANVFDENYLLAIKGRKKENSDIEIPFQKIWLNIEDYNIEKIKISEKDNDSASSLTATYSNFSENTEQMLPQKLNFLLFFKNDKNVNLRYSLVKVNKNIFFPFKIPEQYSPIH